MRKKPILKVKTKRIRRINRTRAKIFGTSERPRLTVFRSNRHLYMQLIDDVNRKTLVSASSLELKDKKSKSDISKAVGELLSRKAKEKGMNQAVFDRRFYKYHGRIKAAAEGVRGGGLKI